MTVSALPIELAARIERLERRFPQTVVALPSGARIAVRTAGRASDRSGASAIVLLHGIGSGAASWLGVVEKLSDAASVIGWDAPGYGASTTAGRSARSATGGDLRASLPSCAGEAEGRSGSRTAQAAGRDGSGNDEPAEAAVDAATSGYVDRLDALLTALGVDSCVLVGHSLGALIATAYAAGRGAARVRRLVLLSPAAGYGAADRAAEREQVRGKRLGMLGTRGIAGIADDAPARMLSAAASDEARAWVHWNAARLNPAGYADAVELLCSADIARAAGRLTMPREVHVGEHDVVTPPAACHRTATALGASFEIIPGAGHAAPVERPGEVARRLAAAARAAATPGIEATT